MLQAAAAALVLSGCTPEPQPAPTPSATASSGKPTAAFTFATAAAPSTLDPAATSDLESWRVTRQVLEGLVEADPTTSEPAPALAVSWKADDERRVFTFTLRKGVAFHDGTPFNAAAVKANFDRWFAFTPAFRSANPTTAFTSVFRAHADQDELSLFKSCTVLAEDEVRIELTQPFTAFLKALTMPAFAISSPRALARGRADVLDQRLRSGRVSRYGLHPVGTGPFSFVSRSEEKVELTANPRYWGERGQIAKLSFVVYDTARSRLQALADGRIDGFDSVTVDIIDGLVRRGLPIARRDPFSVFYLGMNQAAAPLQNERIRRAIAAAINKDAIIRRFYLDDTSSAGQFVPPRLSGFNSSADFPGFDPERSKRLLAEAGYKGEELPFCYPLNVSRSYLPTPEKVYAEISAQLTRVGLNIKPVPIEWSDGYLQRVTSPGDHALHLLGINGSAPDPDNFLTTMFGAKNGEFGYFDAQVFSKIDRARQLPDGPERQEAYLDINRQLATTVPAVPIAYPISAVATSARVASYPTSPVLHETFNRVRLNT
ncbi:ABC transporter substrate-binding protein [Sinomonas halotolerans]|uniref:ABC transporter substrate-binding protein n=1 Tax=Sinomonas halotolerans TaxID=1644133 RepID=UPI003D040142